jgi:excinuclease UvrABC ATPase subunit
MPQEYIEIRGARENNLKNLSLRIPKPRLQWAWSQTDLAFLAEVHVIKNADGIIDMGPEGGSKGGTILFEGTPKELIRAKQSLTSAYLRE